MLFNLYFLESDFRMQQNKGVKQEGESMTLVDPNSGGQGRKVQTQLLVGFESPGRHERRGLGAIFRKKNEGIHRMRVLQKVGVN